MNKKKIIETTIGIVAIGSMIVGLVKKDTLLVILASQLCIFIEITSLKEKLDTKPEEKTGCGCKH